MISDLKTFAHKGCKFVTAEKVFYGFFLSFVTLFKRFLPTLPKVQCPNFLNFGILGEKYGKKVVSDLKTFAYKGFKIAAHFFFFGKVCLTTRIFLVSVLLSA